MEFVNRTTTTHDRETVTVSAEITNAPAQRIRFGVQMWRPETITVTWERFRENGGRWTQWEAYSGAFVSGPKLTVTGDPWPSGAIYRTGYVSESDPNFGKWIAETRPPADVKSGAVPPG
jgi:hypothetical protein